MSHVLDNMIWHAISTGNKNIAMLGEGAGVYHPDIAPFAGLKEHDPAHLDKLYELLPEGRKVAVSFPDEFKPDEKKWKLQQRLPCCQMVCEDPPVSFSTRNSGLVVRLINEHIPQMLELTALTKPGPFLQRTIEFGNYFGVFVEGRLAAMSGQRMHPVPYLEVSAVCTHPDFRGHGYAKACMLQVMKLIIEQGFIPFLHVLTSNSTAIALYESIGFRIRRELNIDVLKRLDS